MATIDWPSGLIPQTAQLTLRKAGTQFASPFNGAVQVFDFVAERWVLSASLAPQAARNPQGVDSFCNTLAGGIERVRVWPFHTHGVPRGTLRGLPAIGSTLARGATALPLANATGGSLLLGGSFELDSDSNGTADGWSAIQGGTVTGVNRYFTTAFPIDGVREQAIDATFGTLPDTFIGIERTYPLTPGTYTLRVQVRGGGSSQLSVMGVEPRDSGGTIIGSPLILSSVPVPGAPTPLGGSFTAPAGTVSCTVRLYMIAVTTGAEASIRWDGVALKPGAVDLSWPGPATLLAGDFIGAGGQLFMVAANCSANDAGAMVVPVINRARGTIAINSPVTWYRPSCEMVLPAMQAGPVRRPGVIDSTALDLVEVW